MAFSKFLKSILLGLFVGACCWIAFLLGVHTASGG